jgi:hypothetical protein
MSQDSLENLGFTEENSIQTEEDRKKEIAMKFIKMSEEAKSNVQEYFKDLYKSQNMEFDFDKPNKAAFKSNDGENNKV